MLTTFRSNRNLFIFCIQKLNENKFRYTNSFKGTSLELYGC